MASILEKYSRMRLRDIFRDSSWVPIRDSSLDWLDLPPDDFLEYARGASLNGEEEPLEGADFHPGATFLLAQAHRIWLTTKKVAAHFPDVPEPVIADLGAYPFTIDRVIRRYLNKTGRLLATVNQAISPDLQSKLTELGVEIYLVNLDPLVDSGSPDGEFADRLPWPDESVDLVIFAHVIEHLYHPIRILRDAARVLKPGGRLILTTDNAFLIGGLLSYLNGSKYLHEPVEGTSAMVFNEWRGHVRYYSEGDLRTLVGATGLEVVECDLCEVMYNSIPEEFFRQPAVQIPRWRADLLTEFPFLRNEILMVAAKPTQEQIAQRFHEKQAEAIRGDAAQLMSELEARRCDLARSTSVDLAFGYRLLFGRWPSDAEIETFRQSSSSAGIDQMVREMLESPEFTSRQIVAGIQRPAHDCVVMTETPGGLRFFFSVRDTFVGFPVAVGVYEPDVERVLRMVLKPGMNCIDVGANLGYFSVIMASIVGESGGRVFSFEPDTFAFGLLEKNQGENRMDEVITAVQVACGEQEGTAVLYRDENPANYGGMYVRGAGSVPGSHGEGTPVPVRAIDDLVPGDVPIGFVKIDVEGSELLVLRGMKGIIERSAPVLLLEYNVASLRSLGAEVPGQLLGELSSAGYSVLDAAAFGQRRVEPFQPDAGTAFANLVCLPPGTDPESYFS